VERHDEIEYKTSSNEREIFIAEKEIKRRLIGKLILYILRYYLLFV
jgi:hypothetical protein